MIFEFSQDRWRDAFEFSLQSAPHVLNSPIKKVSGFLRTHGAFHVYYGRRLSQGRPTIYPAAGLIWSLPAVT